MTVKKTFRLTEHRNAQIIIISDYLKSKGFEGTQTEIIDKAIMDMYSRIRNTDREYFIAQETKRLNPLYERFEENDTHTGTNNDD